MSTLPAAVGPTGDDLKRLIHDILDHVQGAWGTGKRHSIAVLVAELTGADYKQCLSAASWKGATNG